MKTCSTCGCYIPDSMNYCPACGQNQAKNPKSNSLTFITKDEAQKLMLERQAKIITNYLDQIQKLIKEEVEKGGSYIKVYDRRDNETNWNKANMNVIIKFLNECGYRAEKIKNQEILISWDF